MTIVRLTYCVSLPDCDIAPWKDLSGPIFHQNEWVVSGNRTKSYKRLLERQTCGKHTYT